MRHACGVDTSLTDTGVAVIAEDGTVTGRNVKSKPMGASVHARSARIEKAAREIVAFIPAGSVVVIEGPAMQAKNGKPHERGGLWWSVVSRLYVKGCSVTEIPPSTLKKFSTGNGHADKADVLAAINARFVDIPGLTPTTNDNTADALGGALAAAGRAGFQNFLPSLEQVDALKKVEWAPAPITSEEKS